jgi:hypothetical protein
MSQVHFGLQGFEIVRHICLGLTPHSLPGPLLETIQFFIDVHLGGLIVELNGTALTQGGGGGNNPSLMRSFVLR